MVALVVLISSFQLTVHAQDKKPVPQLGKSSLKQVIDAMTVQEKIKTGSRYGFKMPGVPAPKKGEKPKSVDIGGFKLPPSDPGSLQCPKKFQTARAGHMLFTFGHPIYYSFRWPAKLRIEPNGLMIQKRITLPHFPVATLLFIMGYLPGKKGKRSIWK